jgi:hypothetical protein
MKTKTKTTLFLSMLTIAIGFTACTKDSPDPVETIITETITEFGYHAEPTMTPFGPVYTGDYTKFSFSEGGQVEGDNWDIAFRSTHIIVNGGTASDTSQPNRTGNAAVYIINDLMADVTSVDASLLMQDGELSSAIINDLGVGADGGPGAWCEYANQTVTPISGKILIIRTHDDKYAKMEITGFYDTNPVHIWGGFYTFNYVYQSAEGTNF